MAFLRIAALLAVAAAAGCYSPKQPACAFSCVDDGICPAGFTCQSDGVCHRDDSQGTCTIRSQSDAGDASADGSDDTGGGDGGADAS
jgi:hypothetical protein